MRRILFITGQLAETELRQVVRLMMQRERFVAGVLSVPVTIAALLSSKWLINYFRKHPLPVCPQGEWTQICVPGWCRGELHDLEEALGIPVIRGPKDFRELPDFFGISCSTNETTCSRRPPAGEYGAYSVKLFARLPNATQYTVREIAEIVQQYDFDRADVVVLDVESAQPWERLPEVCRILKETGFKVAIDSPNQADVDQAIAHGAEYVFGIRTSGEWNRLKGTDATLVLSSEVSQSLESLDAAISELDALDVNYMVDPGLRPISFGFGDSLGRFLALRWRHPNIELLMNMGTLVERLDGDPLGMLILLLGFCEEQRIWSAMLSPLSNRMCTALSECDHARRMFHYALWRRVLPHRIEPELSSLHDPILYESTVAQIEDFAKRLKDPNYRIYVADGKLHAVAEDFHVEAKDPYILFELLRIQGKRAVDPDYSFYLGYELAKAHTAMTLHKTYRQDESLNWGLHTIPEPTRRERRYMRMELRQQLGADQMLSDEPISKGVTIQRLQEVQQATEHPTVSDANRMFESHPASLATSNESDRQRSADVNSTTETQIPSETSMGKTVRLSRSTEESHDRTNGVGPSLSVTRRSSSDLNVARPRLTEKQQQEYMEYLQQNDALRRAFEESHYGQPLENDTPTPSRTERSSNEVSSKGRR
ncbi:MAG: DUF6513 domain-containing protein [Thermoguttaceae bacterium]|nr:DUF6513 domain-containing protein [Thermoguttaceae bacterium]